MRACLCEGGRGVRTRVCARGGGSGGAGDGGGARARSGRVGAGAGDRGAASWFLSARRGSAAGSTIERSPLPRGGAWRAERGRVPRGRVPPGRSEGPGKVQVEGQRQVSPRRALMVGRKERRAGTGAPSAGREAETDPRSGRGSSAGRGGWRLPFLAGQWSE